MTERFERQLARFTVLEAQKRRLMADHQRFMDELQRVERYLIARGRE